MSFQSDVDARFLDRGAVHMSASRFAQVVLPSPLSLGIAAASILSTIPGISFGLFALLGDGPPAGDDVAAATGALVFFALPPFLLFFLPTLGVAGSNGARAVYAVVGGLLAGSFGVIMTTAQLLQGRDASGGLALTLLGAAPFLATAMIAATVAWLQLQDGLRRDRRRRALLLLERYGSLSEDDLSRGVGGTRRQLWLSLRQLHDTTPLRHEHGRVWTARRLAGRQALLVATVESGERSVAALTEEVREPVDVVLRWLDVLQEAGVLQSTIDGDRITVGGIRAQLPCDGCGGPVKLVGGRVLRCVHCGNEAIDQAPIAV
jgi:Zn finger protein HypA/HybF involved in hydrogenase expression